MKADRRLYITKDGTRIVEQGDPDAAFLWARQGKVIPDKEAEQFGLTEVDGKVWLKALEKPEDKAIVKHEDKAVKRRRKKKADGPKLETDNGPD